MIGRVGNPNVEVRVPAVEIQFWAVLLCMPMLLMALPFVMGDKIYLSLFTDDLFYYIKIAEHVMDGDGSTFNGLVQTNGYQPLWQGLMVVLVAISRTFGINLFLLVSGVIVATNAFYLREIRFLAGVRISALAALLVVINYISFLNIALTGMEVALLVPLLLYLTRYWHSTFDPNGYWLGFVASIAVLTRIDSAILIGALLLVMLAAGYISIATLIRFGVGGILVPLYLLLNMLWFDSALPVSAAAKGVVELAPVLHGWTFRSFVNYGLPTSILNILVLTVWIWTGLQLPKAMRSEQISQRYFLLALWLFVPAYYVVTSLRSDWPIWRWYFYPLVIFLGSAMPLLLRWLQTTDLKLFMYARSSIVCNQLFFGLAFVLLVVYGAVSLDRLTVKNNRQIDAEVLQAFIDTHEGIYAMGDRAGLPAFLVNQPFVQLEGLVMDREYLQRLNAAESIGDFLMSYRVQYYIGSPRKKLEHDCYLMKEPVYSQGYSRSVESPLCWPVVAEVNRIGGGIFLIFKNPALAG